MSGYAELQAATNFSFLRGASHADELAARARELGLAALGVADRHTLAGIVRAHVAARAHGVKLVVGARLDLADGPPLLLWATDRAAYGRLARLLSTGQRRAAKGACTLFVRDVLDAAAGLVAAAVAPDAPDPGLPRALAALREGFGGDLHLAIARRLAGDDEARLDALAAAARAARATPLATNDVHFHAPSRRPLADVLACVREKCTIDEAGFRLAANAERHLKAPDEMARLFRRLPGAVEATLAVAARCRFSLDELAYEYPVDPVPDGLTAQAHLARLAEAGARARWPDGVPERMRAQIAHELGLIDRLGYAPYFLTVHAIVAFARARGILCQGRGSAANSAVCYALGITAVDPMQADLLFERFVSAARDEPPDIDVDFEHERREEVIQHVYATYGRERAGLAASVIRYRPRSALRDVGKALGLSQDVIARLTDSTWGGEGALDPARAREAGIDPGSPRVALTLRLARELCGFPRHLSQHVGGFVITRSRLDEVVPVGNAAMDDRTAIEWDKDDLDALGILKIDLLALGMLTCIRKAFDLIAGAGGERLDLASVPREDPAVYDMLCRGDSLGVFQVESRAQMSMLPRLRPRCWYDLVIEVAIVRPGPIQGDMVHPYLRRREGREAVEYPSEELRAVLGKTLGVPLFQEQAMKIAIVAAGFSAEDADRLRRAMATFRHVGTIHEFRDRFVDGMLAKGYARDFAERCFRQIEGFGTYGFPESHAASFAHLVYVSSWLKRFHPAAFAAALLNSQPMGFYAPAQIVRDAREHGVEVRPPDVNFSDWDCTLEPAPPPRPSPASRGRESEGGAPLPREAHAPFSLPREAGEGWGGGGPVLRLGLRIAKGLAEAEIARLVEARARGGPFHDLADLQRRARASDATLDRLARADAFASLALGRRPALWQALGLGAERFGPDPPPLLAGLAESPAPVPPPLPAMAEGEAVADDYASLRLTLRAHPLALLRARLPRRLAIVPAARLAEFADGRRVAVAGLVLVRQRPGTAKGVIFMTIEDETGVANLIVWPAVFARLRRVVLGGRLVVAGGRLQKQGMVIHVIVDRMADRSDLLAALAGRAGADEAALGCADERRSPIVGGHPDAITKSFLSRDFH